MMVEFYLLTFPRFPLRKKEHKSCFDENRTHDFRTTSRCAGYLLEDHPGGDNSLCNETADEVTLASASGDMQQAPTPGRCVLGGGGGLAEREAIILHLVHFLPHVSHPDTTIRLRCVPQV